VPVFPEFAVVVFVSSLPEVPELPEFPEAAAAPVPPEDVFVLEPVRAAAAGGTAAGGFLLLPPDAAITIPPTRAKTTAIPPAMSHALRVDAAAALGVTMTLTADRGVRGGSCGSGSSDRPPNDGTVALDDEGPIASPQTGQNLAAMGERCPLVHSTLSFCPQSEHTAASSVATLT